jgi:hypothetical protein
MNLKLIKIYYNFNFSHFPLQASLLPLPHDSLSHYFFSVASYHYEGDLGHLNCYYECLMEYV